MNPSTLRIGSGAEAETPAFLAPTPSSGTGRLMSSPVSLIVGLLGLVAIALAAYYGLTPASSLPAFLPGYDAGSDRIHTTHALGSLIVGLALLALAWFQRARD